MKVYVIGINFEKYTLLKKITDHLESTFSAELETLEWLSKKNIDIDKYRDGDVYIYVEIEPVFDTGISMRIDVDECKKSIIEKFSQLNNSLSEEKSQCNDTDDSKIETIVDSPSGTYTFDRENDIHTFTTPLIKVVANGTIRTDLVENHIPEDIRIKKYTGKKSSLQGITVEINGEQHYISKEDFQGLYDLDILLAKNDMVLKEIVVG